MLFYARLRRNERSTLRGSMSELAANVRAIFEYAGKVRDDAPPDWLAWMRSPLWLGILWTILILLIAAFSGQSSKFIYIDF